MIALVLVIPFVGWVVGAVLVWLSRLRRRPCHDRLAP